MFLRRLILKNFRNYESLDIEFKSNITLITGKNAQGKTNLLEAMAYLASLGSQRAKTDSELILWGQNICNIKGNLDKNNNDFELSVTINPPKRREIKVNDIKKTKISEFIRHMCAVNFSVNDLLLLRGSPEDRRVWLDLAIAQIYPSYSDRLQKYNKIKTQKNNYLKEIKSTSNMDAQLLSVLNQQMVVLGSNIVFLRIKFLQELMKIAKEKHKEIAQNENLDVIYNSKVIGDFKILEENCPNIEEISDKFAQKLQDRLQEEITRAQSLAGPHRDDLNYLINGIEAKKFASQGQQRTIVLSLKLAELQLIKEKIDETPILLLDDVLAELDDIRQGFLLDAIGEAIQTVITSVDTLHFSENYLKKIDIFKINGGKLENYINQC